MNIKTKISFVAGLLFLATSNNLNAQIVGPDAFILGDWVEVAVSENGYEGATCPGDTVHCRGAVGFLMGFVANPTESIDWAIYDGDFFTPGVPENGFGFEFTFEGETYSFSNSAAGPADIPGSITSYTETADSITVIWEGSIMDLAITIMYEIQQDQHFYTTSVLVDNTGESAYTDIYYYRSVDPDNNQSIGGSFATTNTIESQSEMENDSVIVSATQDLPYESQLIFHAYGADWKGFIGGFMNRDGSDCWNGGGAITTLELAVNMADGACGVAHKTEELLPGKAASEWFSFASAFKKGISFETDVVDDSGIDENSIDFKLYPNPTESNEVTIDIHGSFTYSIMDMKGAEITSGNGNNITELDLNSIEKGVYFITILQENKMSTQKLILN